MRQIRNPNKQESGLAHIGLIIVAVLVITALAFAGWWVWEKNQKKGTSTVDQSSQNERRQETQESTKNETADWVAATTQGGGFSMKVPDGWTMTKYPGDFLGTLNVAYKQGSPATIENSTVDYVGHSLLFRAAIVQLDDAGLGPQWTSPQPGLEESAENFAIGTLQGKRYKGIFTQDLNQTVYEYVFELGGNQKLDIVYTVDHSKNQKDDVGIAEKAVRSIGLNY